ncbi:hypothetical protein B0H17DRAFT_1136240 [Mycena rosella]|uniref:Uncharacterized protein n=1 Tax=Mycena rosella TaxID=1033263 RepID=A0AAD7GEQ3_MYCRO|nr:hypothetical protein B0H17DRAFT_1136240 [Mycena rosella]
METNPYFPWIRLCTEICRYNEAEWSGGMGEVTGVNESIQCYCNASALCSHTLRWCLPFPGHSSVQTSTLRLQRFFPESVDSSWQRALAWPFIARARVGSYTPPAPRFAWPRRPATDKCARVPNYGTTHKSWHAQQELTVPRAANISVPWTDDAKTRLGGGWSAWGTEREHMWGRKRSRLHSVKSDHWNGTAFNAAAQPTFCGMTSIKLENGAARR